MSAKWLRLAAALMLPILFLPFSFAQQKGLPPSANEDPVLQAMQKELDRAKSRLKLDQMAAPYYIGYRVIDVDGYVAEAAFGALRTNLRARFRFVIAVARVGDYKQDSFYGQGRGTLDLVPTDENELALRHHLWLATDRAYKAATEALTAKQAQLKQYTVTQPVDDFARAEPVRSIGPLAKPDASLAPWLKMLQDASALYQTDPQIESLQASLHFPVVNRYFVDTEGTVVRSSQTLYQMTLSASTQAADGMELDRSAAFAVGDKKELPTAEEFLARTKELLATLKELRAAPVADEEYHGPVLFSADAASTVFAALAGANILGVKPPLGQSARTKGAFASSYKTRVLPEFISIIDDPTLTSAGGKSLLGGYEVDDEGVKAMRVSVIEKGKLENYLLGREPILGFPTSNGHGRAPLPLGTPAPNLGNMIVSSSEPVAREELKKKLLDLCRRQDLPYGYYVETMGGPRMPRLLYRVWVKDGRQELVRGAVFGDLDTRSLRNNLVAAGDDLYVENRLGSVPQSIAAPSILFDELEVKRENAEKSKLPEYPPPPATGSK